MSRKVWQGDVLYFIRKRMPGNQNLAFLDIYEKITGLSLAPARISEIINAEKRGYKGRLGREEFAGQENLFYQVFFEGKDLSVIMSQLNDFLKEEDLVIPGQDPKAAENPREFICLFLRFGLSTLYTPEEDGGLLELNPEQETDAQIGLTVRTIQNKNGEEDLKQDVFTSGQQLVRPGQIVISNWFSLILLILATVVTAMYMTAKEISMTDLLLLVFQLKRMLFAILILSTAIVQKLLGMLEAAALYWSAKKKMGDHRDFLMISKFGFGDGIAKKRGVFDCGFINLRYGLMSNITGALTCIALYIYATRLDGLTYFIQTHPLDVPLLLMFIGSAAFSINWDFMMQNSPSPKVGDMVAENPDHYQMNHLHVLTTMLHQTITLLFVSSVAVYLFWFGYSQRLTKNILDSSFIYVVIFGMFYLWFSSKSPYAKALHLDCVWLFHLIPVFAGIVVWYVLWFYSFSGITCASLMICVVCMWVWRCEATCRWRLFPDLKGDI